MKIEKFTEKTVEIIQEAHSFANVSSHGQITPYHFLAALLKADGTVFPILVAKNGIDIQDLSIKNGKKLNTVAIRSVDRLGNESDYEAKKL